MSRPPPPTDETAKQAVPAPPVVQAQPQLESAQARENASREQGEPIESDAPKPAQQAQPRAADVRARDEGSGLRLQLAADGRATAEPTTRAAETPETAGPAQIGTADSAGSMHSSTELGHVRSAAGATSPHRPAESRAEGTSAKARTAASRRTPEERAASTVTSKAAPLGQETHEGGKVPQAVVPADLWAVSYADDDDRELTESQIAAEASRGNVNRDTLVWREGMEGWRPLGQVPELVKLLPSEQTSDGDQETPAQTRVAAAASVDAPPPLARTTLGVGPVLVPEPAATSMATPVVAAPASTDPVLALPSVAGSGVESSAWAPQQGAANPFMPDVVLSPPQVGAGIAVQSPVGPPQAVNVPQAVSFELEALPPVKTGRPVLWIAVIAGVVALGVIIGLMSSWFGPQQAAAPSVATPNSSAAAVAASTSAAKGGKPPPRPTRAAGSPTTRGGRVDLFAPPATAAESGATAETKKASSHKPNLTDVFADKLQGKGSKR
jgi:hypothetical protein